MIRPLTALTALLAAGSGLYLYQAKHRTQLLDNQIAQTLDHIRVDKSRIAVLSAEWALENAPGRLAELASRYLTLQPMHPDQAIRMADIDARLPPPAPNGATPSAPPDVSAPAPAVVAAMQAYAVYGSVGMLEQPAAAATADREQLAVAAAAPHAAPASAPAAAPAPTQTPRPMPVVALRTPPSPPPPRSSPHPTPAPILASALGGSYPNLPPPAPLVRAVNANDSR